MLSSPRNTQGGIQEHLVGEFFRRQGVTFEKALHDDAHMTAEAQSLQRQDELLRKLLGSDILDEPVPEQLLAALNTSRCAASLQSISNLRARPAEGGRVARLRAAASALLAFLIGAAARRQTRR